MAGFTHEVAGGKNLTDDWLTPPRMIELAGPFDLDPCAAPTQPYPTAKEHYRLPAQNGLMLPWHGAVWCNPPYGPEIVRWCSRMELHNNGLFLIFARTETQGFRGIWQYAAAILFFYKRIQFFDARGFEQKGNGAPSVLAAFGKQNILRLDKVRTYYPGAIVTEWHR